VATILIPGECVFIGSALVHRDLETAPDVEIDDFGKLTSQATRPLWRTTQASPLLLRVQRHG